MAAIGSSCCSPLRVPCIAHQPFWLYQQSSTPAYLYQSYPMRSRPLLPAYSYYPVPVTVTTVIRAVHPAGGAGHCLCLEEPHGTSNAAPPPPRHLSRGANHGARPGRRRRRAYPDAGVHPGRAVQHGRAGRRHGGRQVGRLRPARVRPLAPHPPPLPCPPVGGGPRAAARRRRRRQRAGRRARHALRARRPPVQPITQRQRGRAGAVRAGRHPHRQLDPGHGPLRPHAHPRQGRRHRKDRRHALVPGRDGHHQEGGRAGVRRAHGGHGPRRPPGPRHAQPPRHPGRDRDGAGQVRGSGAEGAAGGEAAQPQVRGRQGAPHRQRLHAPHHPGSGPPRRHARRRIPRRHAPLIHSKSIMSDY